MSPLLVLDVDVRHNAGEVRREIASLPESFDVALFRATEEGTRIFEEEGIRTMGRRPDHAREAIKTDAHQVPGGAEGTAYTDGSTEAGRIAYWRQVGTGIHGPRRHRIVPVEKRALAFTLHGRKFVRASVAGARPNEWFDRAWLGAKERIERNYSSHVAAVLGVSPEVS